MKIPSPEVKAFILKHKIPTTEKQVAKWIEENPPETWAEVPESLNDPMAILQRGIVPIRMRPQT